jgi:PAS domain S-box-containing protein
MQTRQSKGLLHLVGVATNIAQLLARELGAEVEIESMSSLDELYKYIQDGHRAADTLILGMDTEEPVRDAQRIHTYDKHIPILILSNPSSCEQLKRTLMFSPFLGNEIMPWPASDLDELPQTIFQSITRRQQRTNYINTIANAQIRLEKLPLLKPEATHYLDQLLDHAPIGVLTVDINGAILTLNRQAMVILGVQERAALGRPLEELFSTGERQRMKLLIQQALDDMGRQRPEIFEIAGKEQTKHFLEVTPAPLAYRTGQRGAMLILQDVTDRVAAENERKKAEDDLRYYATVLRTFHEISSNLESTLEEKLHRLLKLGCEQFKMPIAILSKIDGKTCCIQDSISDHPAFFIGVSKKLEQTYCSATANSSAPVAVEHVGASQWSQHPGYKENGMEAYIGARVLVASGVYGTLCFASPSPRLSPFSSADFEILKLMSQWVGNELQRERIETHMLKLSGALEQAVDSVIITDRDRRIEYVNYAFEQLTGYQRDEVIGQKTYFLRSGIHDESFYEALLKEINKGGVYRGVMVNKKKNGSLFHERKTIAPLKDNQGNITHFISTGHDITDLVHAEEKDRQHKAELAHVGRLSVLGEMTSGLAHELNQPLCAITTYAQTCLRIIQHDDCKLDDIKYGLEQVVRQAELGGEIFRRLRNFARKGDPRRQLINLSDVIKEVAGFIHADAQQSQIQLKLEIPRRLPHVTADPIQIEQVLLNLVRNSMDALSAMETDQRVIIIEASQHKRKWLRVSIRDTGRGCPKDVVDRLFEPFFTTKTNGLGIGLGISQSIIDAHGGRLWLEENSPMGATFCFTLPSGGKDQNET